MSQLLKSKFFVLALILLNTLFFSALSQPNLTSETDLLNAKLKLRRPQLFRNFNGTQNNIQNTLWGSAGINLLRLGPNSYKDGQSQPRDGPNPRQMSNLIGVATTPVQRNPRRISQLFTIFGQFVDHDIGLSNTQSGQGAQTLDISVPTGDPTFDPSGTGTQTLSFTRSKFNVDANGVRQQINEITSFLDGSQIYGSDEETANSLRSGSEGKLLLDNDLLPKDASGFFKAGDIRANQNLVLTSLHTIFARYHNKLCDEIIAYDNTFNDQKIFQIARNQVIAILQKITFKDYLPIVLGDAYDALIGNYFGYDPLVNPSLNTEFSSAAYRFGHGKLIPVYWRADQTNTVLQNIPLDRLLMNPSNLNSTSVNQLLRGQTLLRSKKRDTTLVNQIRNLLITTTNRRIKADLFSLNVQRGRDHGVPTYNQARQAFGLATVNSFSDITSDTILATNLQNLYGSVDQIDLWIGIMAQDAINNAELGQLGVTIVGKTFRKIRDGDRFWYEDDKFPKLVRDQIQNIKLGDIVNEVTTVSQYSGQTMFVTTQTPIIPPSSSSPPSPPPSSSPPPPPPPQP